MPQLTPLILIHHPGRPRQRASPYADSVVQAAFAPQESPSAT